MRSCGTPAIVAQLAQQKYRPPGSSTPWPTMRHPQCSHVGAIAWIAHSNESNVPFRSGIAIVMVFRYSLPQTSHRAIVVSVALADALVDQAG
jgi:hypothetical protein